VNIEIPLETLSARATALAAVLASCALLLYVVLCDFVIGALTDERILMTPDATPGSFIIAPLTEDRVGVNPEVLKAVSAYLPYSPRLHMRIAESEMWETRKDLPSAEFHALRAVALSPHDYRPLLLLASIRESKEEFQAAEESARAALRFAPNNPEAHWQLATLLLNGGKLAESLGEFRLASSGHVNYFLAALDMVWRASREDLDSLRAVTPNDQKRRLALARFLLQQSRPSESATIFKQIGRSALLDDWESSEYLDAMIAAKHLALARELWSALVSAKEDVAEAIRNPVWNGGFESDILLSFAHFDWSIASSNYAQISIDTKTAHSGTRSLRLDFVGRDTTRLDKEVKQLTLIHPGTHYRLHCYVKTDGLVTPEGPRVVVTESPSTAWIAASNPVPSGSNDWQLLTIDFAAPSPALLVSVKRQPRFSYDDPTRGTVWFDDFQIRALNR
jgi:tetratricopeptide (TPR) repeat protein